MDTALRWRAARAVLERATVFLRKRPAQERQSLHRSPALDCSPSNTREKYLSSGDRFTVSQQDVGNLSTKKNQPCTNISTGDNDGFKLSSYAEEFVPQLKTTQYLVLNPRAGEFVPKAKHGKSTQPLNFNPSAREFVPKMKQGHSAQPLNFNPSAREFVPKAKQGHSAQPLNFNPSAREFVPKPKQGHSTQPLVLNCSASEFVPKAKQELLTQTVVLNPNAEFVIKTKHEHPAQLLILNPGAGEFVQKVKQGSSSQPLTLNPNAGYSAPHTKQKNHFSQSYAAQPYIVNISADDKIIVISDQKGSLNMHTHVNMQHRYSALDLDTTPVSYRSLGSISLRENNAKPMTGNTFLMCPEECRGQAAEVKIQTPGHSEQELQSTKSQVLKPFAKLSTPLVRNVTRRSPKADETNTSLQQKRSVVDLENTQVSFQQTESSNLGGDTLDSRSVKTFPLRPEECTGNVTEEEVRNHGYSEQESQPKRSKTFNIFAKPFVPLGRKVSMCSSKADHTNASRQQQAALDLENTPVSSSKKGSFSLREKEANPRPRKTLLMRLEECTHFKEEEIQTAGPSELESPSTRNLTSFPTPHTLLARNVSLITPSTAILRELLRKRTSNSKLASMESVKRQLQTECIGHAAEEEIQTAGHPKQERQSRTPRRLNPAAKPFIPLMRNASPRSPIADKINTSLQQRHPVLDLENMPVTSKPIGSSNLLGDTATPRSGNTFLMRQEKSIEHAVEERFQTAACKEQESQPTNSQSLTTHHNRFTSLLRNISRSSHNGDETNADLQQKHAAFDGEKNPLTTTLRGLLSKRPSNSKLASIESKRRRLDESMEHAEKLRAARSRPFTPLTKSLTSMLRNGSLSSSNADKTAGMQQKQAALQPETTLTTSTLGSGLDSPKDNFRRTPRREYQGCLRRGEDDDDLEINGPHPHRQYECLRILSSLPLAEDDEFLDTADHQFNPRLDFGTSVTDELEYDPTNHTARLDTAEVEAGRLQHIVSSRTCNQELVKARYQHHIQNVNKIREAEKREFVDMQLLLLDPKRQAAIDRVAMRMMQAELIVRQHFETRAERVSVIEKQETYQGLCSYKAYCNAEKREIEMLARELQETLVNGQQVDLSVFEKQPLSYQENRA